MYFAINLLSSGFKNTSCLFPRAVFIAELHGTSLVLVKVNHARIRSSNQSVLSNEDKTSCSKKQGKSLMGFDLRTHMISRHRETAENEVR